MAKSHPFHEFPKFLHRGGESAPLTAAEIQTLSRVGFPGPIVVHDAESEALARKAGYQDDYDPAAYAAPKGAK